MAKIRIGIATLMAGRSEREDAWAGVPFVARMTDSRPAPV